MLYIDWSYCILMFDIFNYSEKEYTTLKIKLVVTIVLFKDIELLKSWYDKYQM
jgi:hypothetical protein